MTSFAPVAALRTRVPAHPTEPLELPAPWVRPARPPVPLLASVVPVLGAVALWLVTGSVLALWLAALGPVIAGATLADAARAARRDRRRAEREAADARERIAGEIDARHAQERAHHRARHPDVAAFTEDPAQIWRAVPGRSDALVLGSGARASELRVSGGGEDAPSVALRRRAATVQDAPVAVPIASTVAVVGPPALAAAVVRALVLRVALALPPGALRVVGPLRDEHAWADELPHRRSTSGLRLALAGPGEPVPRDADIAVLRLEQGAPRPPGCEAVLTVRTPAEAELDADGEVRPVAVEAVGLHQARRCAARLVERAGADPDAPDAVLALSSLLTDRAPSTPGRLRARIGLRAGEVCELDLVQDGPHAIVAGVTGSGKSELLITWVLALCAAHSPQEVVFLLADFKGGTAFDGLTGVPHVTGVITDLDGTGARRAIQSLRAEVRRREGELARNGARDIDDPRMALPRLVIVVDEFAALLAEHPELHAVFTDVAARGRALGMHLILGTQRPSGIVREGLLANCPLRVSLRVTDPTDSRALIGTDEAARLPGGADHRGIAMIRAAGDAAPRRVRIALSSPADARAVAAAAAGSPAPRRSWLPDLPTRLELGDLAHEGAPGLLVLGLADEPEQQTQRPVGLAPADRGLMIVGSGGSGKSTALRTLAAGAPAVVRVTGTGEQIWDAVTTAEAARERTLIVIDDVDALDARLPPEYARDVLERVERLARGAGESGIRVIAAAQRLTGGAARIAELLPRRLILATGSRAEHTALGGDPAGYAAGSVPGRGWLDGRAVQVALSRAPVPDAPPPTLPWVPVARLTGLVHRRAMPEAIASWTRGGVHAVSVDQFAQGGWGAADSTLVVGDVEEWQRQWRALTDIRADHDLLIDARCAGEFRTLTGARELPPYCDPTRPRGWLLRAGAAPERVALPPIS